jgi:putative metallohydrolase (TIGR04338 family)
MMEQIVDQARDNQKSRLYKAENVLNEFSERLETVPEMADYLTKVMNRAPIQARYGAYLEMRTEVRDGRGCRRALGSRHWIKMPKWARTQFIVLHEYAHALTIRKFGSLVADHGREYASVYLDLVRFGLGKEAHDALVASFKANRVRYRLPGGKAKPVISRRVVVKAAAKVKPKAPKPPMDAYQKQCARERRAFMQFCREHDITYEIERFSGDITGYITLSTFPASEAPFTTMHYDWSETMRRIRLCLKDPSLLDEEGGYSE